MTCHNCKIQTVKAGKSKEGNQRYKCNSCKRRYTEQRERLFGNMYLSEDKALLALQMLVEGNSIRSIERVLDIQKKTLLSLLQLAGERCESFLTRKMRKVSVKDLQFDEIWTYVRMKEKTKTRKGLSSDQLGDAYCFVAFERDSKLIPVFHLGRRTEADTLAFTEKVFEAVDGTTNKIQISTDGFKAYEGAIGYSLGMRSSYAQLVKVYGVPLDEEDQHRYSPSKIKECIPTPLWGNPNPERICTSHVERQNLNIRTAMRRFTRLTIGFSKKWENLKAALALYFAYYNFVRIHSSIRCTPAMESGITKHVWSLRELLAA
jgi:transposase-like protein/IS1 family transposase